MVSHTSVMATMTRVHPAAQQGAPRAERDRDERGDQPGQERDDENVAPTVNDLVQDVATLISRCRADEPTDGGS